MCVCNGVLYGGGYICMCVMVYCMGVDIYVCV